MSIIKNVSMWLAGITAMAIFIYLMWSVVRKINYSYSYEDMVERTVCETVKPEHLKEGACQ